MNQLEQRYCADIHRIGRKLSEISDSLQNISAKLDLLVDPSMGASGSRIADALESVSDKLERMVPYETRTVSMTAS